jgi:hypothetical protein
VELSPLVLRPQMGLLYQPVMSYLSECGETESLGTAASNGTTVPTCDELFVGVWPSNGTIVLAPDDRRVLAISC